MVWANAKRAPAQHSLAHLQQSKLFTAMAMLQRPAFGLKATRSSGSSSLRMSGEQQSLRQRLSDSRVQIMRQRPHRKPGTAI